MQDDTRERLLDALCPHDSWHQHVSMELDRDTRTRLWVWLAGYMHARWGHEMRSSVTMMLGCELRPYSTHRG